MEQKKKQRSRLRDRFHLLLWAMGKSTYRRLLHSLFPDLRRIMAIIPTQKAGDFKFLEKD